MAGSTDQILIQKLKHSEDIIVSLNCYQIFQNVHENRLLCLVRNENGSFAVFSFNVKNIPPTVLSDLSIDSVFPINEVFFLDTVFSDTNNSKIQIISGNTEVTYFYYPLEDIIKCKTVFEGKIRSILQESEDATDFAWLDYYKQNDMIDIELAFGSKSMNRESKFREILEKRKPEYMTTEPYKIFCGTWNVNLNAPNTKLDLSKWLLVGSDAPDIYAIGFQEINMSPDTILLSESRPDQPWINKIEEGLAKSSEPYSMLKCVRYVGMMLTIFCKQSIKRNVRLVLEDKVGTGTLNFGNKGAVCASIQLNETYICFVNSHLAAHVQEFERRNEDHDEILRKIQFTEGIRMRSIEEHDQIYWLGDLNYRLDVGDADIKTGVDYKRLGIHDQLYKERVVKKRVFNGYQEGEITFRPTYKYDPGTDDWDSSEKNRAPAWCDRIFWKTARLKVEQIAYNSIMDIRDSDHKPVFAIFIAYILTRDENKFKKVHEEVLKTVDKYENENQPQLFVPETDLDFGILKFHEKSSRELVVANNCHLSPVNFEFRSKDDTGTNFCEDWVQISHKKNSLETGQSLSINIDVFVGEKTVSKLLKKLRDAGSGKREIDILVLHVENGRDIFITIFGEFKPSFFGLRPETLMKLAKPIADYEISELMLIDRDDENKIPYQEENTIVPRQLFLLIDYLYKNGLKTRELFTVNRKYKNSSKIHQIRDWLDENSSRDCPGTPQTVAETLLKFLESLPSPLITISERELSIYSAYFEKCRDLLQNKVSLLNRKIFWYILMFLKESQKYYNVNGLDDRLLANVFGRVLCRHSNEQYQQRFVLNFLQNDIETFAKCDYKNLFH